MKITIAGCEMNGRPTEIAHLNGAITARAAKHGIDAPANALITA